MTTGTPCALDAQRPESQERLNNLVVLVALNIVQTIPILRYYIWCCGLSAIHLCIGRSTQERYKIGA